MTDGTAQVLVLDLGGTQIKYGLVSENGHLHGKGHIPSRCDSIEHLREDLASIRDSVHEPYAGIAASFPGRVNTDTGIAYTGGSFKHIVNFPFQDMLEEIFSVPASIANDANCAASAELWKGCLQDTDSAALLIMGTGLGGGIILDHQVYMGSSLTAAELCFIAADYERVFDVDYSAFVFSRVCAKALTDHYAVLKHLDPKTVDGVMVFDACEAGEKEAVETVRWLADNTAITIFTMQCILDVDVYVIGGGISARQILTEEIQNSLDILFDRLSATPVKKPELKVCAFRNDANLIGALYYYKKKYGKL